MSWDFEKHSAIKDWVMFRTDQVALNSQQENQDEI